MGIKLGWVKTVAGKRTPCARIQVSFTLSKEEMAGALIAYDAPQTPEELETFRKMSKAEAERRIRDTLEYHAESMHYYGDKYNGFSQVYQSEAEDAAMEVITRMVGE